MPIIQPSRKLSLTQEEYCICSGPYVFFRLIADNNGVRLMTATASESIGKYQAFGDQELLTSKTMQVFEELDMHVDEKQDHADRAYVQTAVVPDRDHLISLAVRVLDRIGFEDVAVLAMREMKALYEEFAINDDEEFYLGDGMKVTSDGRLVES